MTCNPFDAPRYHTHTVGRIPQKKLDTTIMGAIELLDDLILDLEGKLNLGENRVVVFCVLTSLVMCI